MSLNDALQLHQSGDLAAAADAYARALASQPGNHDAQYGLGTVRLQQGDAEAAAALLADAVRTAPGVPEYHFNFGIALQQLEQHFAAVEQFDIASQLRPDGQAIWLSLARSLTAIRNYPAALKAQEKALDIEPGNAADLLTHAELLFMCRQPDDCRYAISKARELGSKAAQGHFLEARCEHIAGNSEAELELLNKAIARRPGYGDAWQYRLELTPEDELLSLADDCEALAGDVSVSPRDSAILYYTSGRAHERLGNYGEAFDNFSAGNQRQSKDATKRGKAYDRAGNDNFASWISSESSDASHCASRTPAEKQPIFIVGLPRSGTTLVERILAGLEGVIPGGESEAMELVSRHYYNALANNAAPSLQQLDTRHCDELAAQYWRFQTGERCRLTDKMPTNFRHVGLITRMFPDSPIVYLRRDPRDVAMSIWSRYFPDGHDYATDFDNLAHYIAFSEKVMRHWQSVHDGRILAIDYETLIGNPENESRRLAQFCGLTWAPDCLDVQNRRDGAYTFSELQVREPLNAKGIGRWRQYAQFLGQFITACDANGVQLRDN